LAGGWGQLGLGGCQIQPSGRGVVALLHPSSIRQRLGSAADTSNIRRRLGSADSQGRWCAGSSNGDKLPLQLSHPCGKQLNERTLGRCCVQRKWHWHCQRWRLPAVL
jgi:hypothetical protein